MFWFIAFIISSILQFGNMDVSEKIKVIPIKGVISSSDSTQFRSVANSGNIIKELAKAERDSSVKGVILEINSPGGEVVASKHIADAVKASKKPVVALIGSVGASGAYWIASASDVIIADPLSTTGSIGVFASYIDFAGVMDDYGVNYNQLVSGKYKDVGSPFKKLEKKEKDLLQSKLDKIHDYFIEDISRNRNISKSKVKNVADGFFMLGMEAKDAGLVDHLGDIRMALNITRTLSKSPTAKLYYVKEPKRLMDLLSKLGMSSFYQMGLGIGDSIVSSRIASSFRIDA